MVITNKIIIRVLSGNSSPGSREEVSVYINPIEIHSNGKQIHLSLNDQW